MLKQDVGLSGLEFITDLSPSESERVNGGRKYTVKQDETLWELTGGNWDCINKIVKRNKNIRSADLIKEGQQIEVVDNIYVEKGHDYYREKHRFC